MRIYRYIIRHDAGTAPNPYDAWCTLAICKPAIRRTAVVGDWIVGFHAAPIERGHVIYAMRVAESLTFAEYWRDSRFSMRKPSKLNAHPDNFYKPVLRPDGSEYLIQAPNHVHDKGCAERDVSGGRVLVSKQFWYFGNQSTEMDKRLPPELMHLAPRTQGHVVDARRRPNDIEYLLRWLGKFSGGMLGSPTLQPTSNERCLPCGSEAKTPRVCLEQ